jgi:hypothetical protein
MFAREKRCQQCGQAFDCGGLLGCWCWKVKLDAAARAALREQYSDCLCPACLNQSAAGSQGQPEVTHVSLTRS